jgi:hypothetical protein
MIGPQRPDTREQIEQTAASLTALLLEKNRRYGDSALNPPRVFAKSPEPGANICARLDDKLGRIANAETLRKNDVADLMGYLVLLCVAQGWTDFSELLD